jgi:3-oxoacyl-[acyl-carrier protein] reductase
MLLENKVAVIYGAGGPIGGAVARAFAREGTRVFLAGRTKAKLDKVADEIRSNGGVADTDVVDALDERSVDKYVDAVVEQAGTVDISFNLISYADVQEPLTEISVEDFLQPITNAMRTQFLTTRAAARHMVRRGSGVILAFGGDGPQTLPGLGGFREILPPFGSVTGSAGAERADQSGLYWRGPSGPAGVLTLGVGLVRGSGRAAKIQ